jgi:membrane protease YdiL (CAAX protease family)
MRRPQLALTALCLVLPAVAWRVGGMGLWWIHLGGYAAATALALWLLHDDGELQAAVTPRSGDISLGFGVAATLFLPIFFFISEVLAPSPLLRICTERGSWVGPPSPSGARAALEWLRDGACVVWSKGSAAQGTTRAVMVVAIATLEELAWRGGVQHRLSDRLGATRGWLAASALYALAHLAAGSVAMSLLALPAGLAWGLLFRVRGTLVAPVLSHAVFSFFFMYRHALFAVRPSGL